MGLMMSRRRAQEAASKAPAKPKQAAQEVKSKPEKVSPPLAYDRPVHDRKIEAAKEKARKVEANSRKD